MNPLQKVLFANCIFSGTSGALLILLQPSIAQLFETENQTVFWTVGIALIFFSGTIAYEIKKLRKWAVAWIIIQDALWILGSLILLIFQPFNISFTGNILIVAVGLLVLILAILQYKNFHQYVL